MKNTILSAFIAWSVTLGNPLFAQFYSLETLLQQPATSVPSFDTTACPTCIHLGLGYGSTQFVNLDVLARFDGRPIQSVEMVYSAFSRSKNFDQKELNRERLERLMDVAPELFGTEVTWTIIRQTDAASIEESQRLFHGFVVHFPVGTAKLDQSGKLKPVDDAPVSVTKSTVKPKMFWKDTMIVRENVFTTKTMKKKCRETGKYLPRDKDERIAGIRYDSERDGLFHKRLPEKQCSTYYEIKHDTVRQNVKVQYDPRSGKFRDASLTVDRSAQVVAPAIERNWTEWKEKEIVMVTDVTGSMSVYVEDLVKWQDNYAKNGVQHFIFFNDGDRKRDHEKIIGKIGGIYYIQSTDINEIQDKARAAMNAGHGGDTPENNVESILKAEEVCKTCKETVMIADAYAAVKDLELVRKIRKPVHIIVCGGDGTWIHPDYLTIAAFTKGSVHTEKMDMEFSTVPETVEMGKYRFDFDLEMKKYIRQN